ncbi:hypothetical protein [Streptomyces ochraceiscleroticus]|uniref:Uncharacterized protein n=1 Tax=Streptomyces ochraceiscleroticus TaxID=47761 RepID=A0ABW1MPQ5_9ACTN|nr:hypothetical protein [Streptomyces ochraceiscleroticus]
MAEPGDLRQTYAFSCTGCGHAWKQTYDIVIVTDSAGQRSQEYRIEGRRVRSPLTSPICPHCERRHVHAVPVGLAERALEAETAPQSRPERDEHTPHIPHGPHFHLRRHSGRTRSEDG